MNTNAPRILGHFQPDNSDILKISKLANYLTFWKSFPIGKFLDILNQIILTFWKFKNWQIIEHFENLEFWHFEKFQIGKSGILWDFELKFLWKNSRNWRKLRIANWLFGSKPQEFFKRNPEIFQNLFPELKEKYFFKTFGINFNIFLTSTIHIINNAKQNWIQKFRNNWFYVIVYSPCFVSLVTLQVHYTQINLHSFYISSHVCVCGNWSYNFFSHFG